MTTMAPPLAVETFLPPLSTNEKKQLRTSIETFGVLEPIVRAYGDPEGLAPDGEIVDGNHRYEICQELGKECPERRVEGLTGDDRRTYAFMYNWNRRQLQWQQQREVVTVIEKRLIDNPTESDRRIAALLGVSYQKVREHRKELETAGSIPVTKAVAGGQQQGTNGAGGSRVVVKDDDDEEEAAPKVSEHMRTGLVEVSYTHWVESMDPRQRGARTYGREWVRRKRTYPVNSAGFVMPPEAQNDQLLFAQNLMRQLYASMVRDPVPRLPNV